MLGRSEVLGLLIMRERSRGGRVGRKSSHWLIVGWVVLRSICSK